MLGNNHNIVTPKERRNKIREAMQQRMQIKAEIYAFASEVIPDINSIFYRIGYTWECPVSPIGLCVYDHMKDPAHDDCIFCHNPEERK